MAQAGGGSGYVRLQTPESGISQATQFWGAQEARRAGDEKLADERQGVRDDEAIKDWESTYNLKAEDFASKYTGFKSYDDMNTDFSLYVTDEYVNLQRAAKEAMISGNTKGKAEAEGQMVRLKGAFKEASKSQEALGTLFAGYQKASSEGKVSGASKDFENAMQAGFQNKNVALRFKDGNLVYTGLDSNGKVISIPQQDIMDGSFNWIEKQDLYGKAGLISNMINNLGTTSTDSINGYMKTTSQVWDDKVQGAATDSSIETLMGSDDVMADLLYQVSKGKISKRVGFSEKDYDLVKKELRTQIKGGYDQVTKKDFDSGKYGTDVSAALTRQRMLDEKNAKEPNKDLVEAEPVTTSTGQLKKGLQKANAGPDEQFQSGGEFTLKTKGGSAIKGVISDDSDAEILSLKRSEDGIYANTRVTNEVTEKDQRTGSSKKVNRTSSKLVKLTDEEVSRLARRMNLPTAGDLTNYLQDREDTYSQRKGKGAEEETLKW
jgi:hypothetical protein